MKLLSQVARLFASKLVCLQQMRDAAGNDMHCRQYMLSTNSGPPLGFDQRGFLPRVVTYTELAGANGPLSLVVLGQPANAVRAWVAAAPQKGMSARQLLVSCTHARSLTLVSTPCSFCGAQNQNMRNPFWWLLRLLEINEMFAPGRWRRQVPPATAAFLLSQPQGWREVLVAWLTMGDGSRRVAHSLGINITPHYIIDQCSVSLNGSHNHSSIVSVRAALQVQPNPQLVPACLPAAPAA